MNYLFCYAFNVFAVCVWYTVDRGVRGTHLHWNKLQERACVRCTTYVCVVCGACFVKNQWIYVFIDTSTSSIWTYGREHIFHIYLFIKALMPETGFRRIWFDFCFNRLMNYINRMWTNERNGTCVFMTTKCDVYRCQDPFDSISNANKIDCENGESVCVCICISVYQ